MAGGESFSDAFTAFPLLAFRLVFRGNLEFTLSVVRAYLARASRAIAASIRFYRVRGGVSPTYESGDKVTLRNCFPRADEGELSPARTVLSPPYPPFRLLNPTHPLVLCYSAISSCCAPRTRLFPARFHSVLLRRSARGEESRIYAKSMREGVLRNRYFVTG